MAEVHACPGCGLAVQVSEDQRGQEVRCPECGDTVVAGGPTTGVQATPPAPPAPPSAPPPTEGITTAPRPAPDRPLDDELPDDELPPSVRRPIGTSSDPASMTLVFGVLGVLLGLAGMCCQLFAVAGLAFSVTGWIIGRQTLRGMDEGRLDPRNRGTAQAGHILGIVGTVIALVWFALTCAMFAFQFGLIFAEGRF